MRPRPTVQNFLNLIKFFGKFGKIIGWRSLPVADLQSKILDAHSRPPGSKFFQFHAVLGKIWQNRMLTPPPGELALPPRGNPGSGTAFYGESWIRPCLYRSIHIGIAQNGYGTHSCDIAHTNASQSHHMNSLIDIHNPFFIVVAFIKQEYIPVGCIPPAC